MTDIFDQEGINFSSARMASTHPTATPEPITAPKVDMSRAPAPTVAPVSMQELTAPIHDRGAPIPSPANPQAVKAMSSGTEALGPAGAAPPQPETNSGVDIFDKENIDAGNVAHENGNSFARGVNLGDTSEPDASKVAAYMVQQKQQTQQLASHRFTPEQMQSFANNPISISEAIKASDEWPDVPMLLQEVQAGQSLTDTQTNRLNDYVDSTLKFGMRGMSWNGNTAEVGQQLPASAVNYVRQGVSGAQPTDDEPPVQPNLNGGNIAPPPYAPQAGEKPLNQFAAVTDKGRHVMASADDAPASTALRVAAYISPETAANPVMPKTPLISSINDLPPNLKSAIYDAYKQQNPKAQMSDVYTQSGWSKVIDAIGESKAATILKEFMGPIAGMSELEHNAAEWHGEMLPVSGSEDGTNTRLDWRSGITSAFFSPGDVVAGKLKAGTEEFNQAAQGVALFGITKPPVGKILSVAERGIESPKTAQGEAAAKSEGQATPSPESPTEAQPEPTVDHYMDAVHPAKDQMLVDGGIISIDGAKSTDTKATENILKNKGLTDIQAQETTSNMTANEKEQFINQNIGLPKGTYPSGVPVESAANFSEEMMAKHGVDVGLIDTSDGLHLSSIKVNEAERGQGYGTAAMQDIIDYADSQGKRIILTPTTDFGASSVNRLQDFYKQFGFVDNKGRNETPSTRETMYRNPQEGVQPSGAPVQAAGDVATAIADSQLQAMQAKEPPPINDFESGYNIVSQKMNYLYRRLVNILQPIENAESKAIERGTKVDAGQSPKNLSNLYGNVGGLVNHYLTVENFSWLPDGSTKVTGKSLKAIMDDFDNIALRAEASRGARYQDFNDYLLANRYIELEKAGEGKARPEQVAWSTKRLKELSQKYGDDLHQIETLSQEIYQFQQRTLDMLVDTGVVSGETRDTLNAKYSRYVPLDRVFDEVDQTAYARAQEVLNREAGKASPKEIKRATKDLEGLANKYGPEFDNILSKTKSDAGKSSGKFSGAGPQGIIQRLKGSAREARDPLLNIMERTMKAVDRGMRNRVAQSVDRLKEVLPEHIQDEQPRIVKKGKAEVRITHDPVLDQKLDAAIEHFKNTFERKKSLKVKGYRNVLGSYDPMEKLVRAKLGANEAVKTHEVGHMLDFELGLGEKLLKDKTVKNELRKLAEERIGKEISTAKGTEGIEFVQERKKVGSKYVSYIKNDREIIANMFDAYVNAPELLDKIAPKAKAEFEKLLGDNPELSFIKDIKPSLSREERVIEKDVYGEAPELPPNTIEVYKDGERNLLRVSKPLYEAMTQLGPARVMFLERLMRGTFGLSAKVLRTGATSTVSFIERNVFRDQLDATIQGGVGYLAPWDFAKGLVGAFGHNKLYNDWVKAGGKMHFMPVGDKGVEEAYHELIHGEGRFKQIVNALPRLSEKFEHATRIGLYNAAKRSGQADLEAAMSSLEGTLNFGRSGDVTRKLNQYVPFLNAGVQATDKLIRTAYNHPTATMMWGLGVVTIPSMMITGYYLHQAPENERREYLEIPQWQKDIFWTVKIDGEWHSFPKPFSWGYIFGSVPERMMISAFHKDGDPEGKSLWSDMAKGLFGTLSPVNDWSASMPPIIKVIAEWQSNHNFFMGRSIYPPWMDDLPPAQRKNAYTSQTAQLIGEKLGTSPALLENTLRGLTGGAGGYGLRAGDAILNAAKRYNGEKVSARPISMADNILLQGFSIRDPSGNTSNSVQNFYDNYELAKQAHNGLKNIPEAQKEQYIQTNEAQLNAFRDMEASHKKIASLHKEATRIYDDTDMSAEEKTVQIKTINQQISDIARQANINYDATAKPSGAGTAPTQRVTR